MGTQKIFHPKHGAGTVLDSRHKGFELLVGFSNGRQQWVRFDELTAASDQRVAVDAVPDRPPRKQNNFKSRRMVDAFRLGIVPFDAVDGFLYGRGREGSEIKKWLETSSNPTLLVIGDYGSGKTHLLQHTAARALATRYAVAHVELDIDEAPFSRPKRIFRHLVRSFRYLQNGRLAGFREFVRAVMKNNAFASHAYFKHLTDPTDETLWEWVEAGEQVGRPRVKNYSYLPCLYDYTVTVNIYSYLLSGLGWAAKQALGLEGLLLIFDEAETLDATASTLNVERGRNFLSAMSRVAQNHPALLGAPHNTGLRFHRGTLPFLFKSPCSLKLMFLNVLSGQGWVLFQNLGLRPAVPQQISDELDRQPSPLNHRLAQQVIGINDDSIVRIPSASIRAIQNSSLALLVNSCNRMEESSRKTAIRCELKSNQTHYNWREILPEETLQAASDEW